MEMIFSDSSILGTTPPGPHNNNTVTNGDNKHTNKNITITVKIFAPKKQNKTKHKSNNNKKKCYVTVSLHSANSTGSTAEGRRDCGNMPVELNGMMKCISRGRKIQTHTGEQAITASIKVS